MMRRPAPGRVKTKIRLKVRVGCYFALMPDILVDDRRPLWVRIGPAGTDPLKLEGMARLCYFYLKGGLAHKLELVGCLGDLDADDAVPVRWVPASHGPDAIDSMEIVRL